MGIVLGNDHGTHRFQTNMANDVSRPIQANVGLPAKPGTFPSFAPPQTVCKAQEFDDLLSPHSTPALPEGEDMAEEGPKGSAWRQGNQGRGQLLAGPGWECLGSLKA